MTDEAVYDTEVEILYPRDHGRAVRITGPYTIPQVRGTFLLGRLVYLPGKQTVRFPIHGFQEDYRIMPNTKEGLEGLKTANYGEVDRSQVRRDVDVNNKNPKTWRK